MEVATGIHQLKIPIPGNPLGYLCAYLIKTPESCMLIDTGFPAVLDCARARTARRA